MDRNDGRAIAQLIAALVLITLLAVWGTGTALLVWRLWEAGA